ncbi:MAG: hypothetical protein WB699_11220, partial [Bacteroidota bacterium]
EVPFFTNDLAHTTFRAVEPSRVLDIPRLLLSPKLEHDHIYAADLYRAVIASMSDKYHRLSLKFIALLHETGAEKSQSDLVQATQEEIDRFKALMVRIDKEAIKSGVMADSSTTAFMDQANSMMKSLHRALGEGSPLTGSEKEQLGASLQNDMLPYLLTTGTAERFYSKPRGYAGDYLAIHGIYQNMPSGASRLGPLIDRMFLEMPPCIAVRNRRKLLAGEILRTVEEAPHQARVMCLASGPASEVFDAFSELPDKTKLKMTLLDIDLQALAFVDDLRGKSKLATQIDLINENLIALFLGRGRAQVPLQNMIYSVGLIDYLNDKLVGKLLHFAYDHLNPGGRIILGNFHPDNPAKEFMDHVLEWNLIHRTEEDMHRLFLASPFRSRCTKITFEECRIDLFAECVKTAD